MKTYQVRQGDVPLVMDVIGKPRGKKVASERIILARGESTGNEHVLSGDVELYELERPERVPGYKGVMSTQMVLVNGIASFAHVIGDTPTQEHDTIEVKPGLYWRLTQWEYTPQEIRRIAD